MGRKNFLPLATQAHPSSTMPHPSPASLFFFPVQACSSQWPIMCSASHRQGLVPPPLHPFSLQHCAFFVRSSHMFPFTSPPFILSCESYPIISFLKPRPNSRLCPDISSPLFIWSHAWHDQQPSPPFTTSFSLSSLNPKKPEFPLTCYYFIFLHRLHATTNASLSFLSLHIYSFIITSSSRWLQALDKTLVWDLLKQLRGTFGGCVFLGEGGEYIDPKF